MGLEHVDNHVVTMETPGWGSRVASPGQLHVLHGTTIRRRSLISDFNGRVKGNSLSRAND